jgi:sec-independent protein translocase protein TatA
MFGYNFTTLIIILVIALLLFGPKRLPELGDSIGKAIRGFKKATEDDHNLPGADPKPAEPLPAPHLCQQCHKEITGVFAFCPHCGQRMKEEVLAGK